MKKLFSFLALLIAVPLFAQGQRADSSNPLGGDIRAASTNCSVAVSCVWQKLPANATTLTVTVTNGPSGSFVATLQFEQSADGGFTFSSASPASTATIGTFTFTVTSFTDFRVRASAFTSGDAAVNMQAAGSSTGGSGGGGTVTSITATSPIVVTPSPITGAGNISCPTCGTGSSGTVTSFSSGNLVPLFTTSVANPTTTPTQSFTLSNAAANTVFGNNTGSTAAPAFVSITKAMLPGTTVFTDQTNVFGAFLQDFSASTMKIPQAAGFTATSNSTIGLDTTANAVHFFTNAADSINAAFATAPTGSKCLHSSGTVGLISETISDCATGTVNPATQFALPYYSAAGSASTISGVAGPTTPNGVGFFPCETPSGGAVAPIWCWPGVPIRAASSTSDTIVAPDRSSVVTENNAGAIAVTLPQAGTTNFANNFNTAIFDIGAGLTTVTPTISTINGAASQIIPFHWGSFIFSDNANYRAMTIPDIAAFPNCVDSGGNHLNFTTATGAFSCGTTGGGGSAALSSLTAATASNTIANGNNPQTWNWALTTDAIDGLAFGETSAATGGTLTNALANQAVIATSTATNSTATPLEVAQGSITNTVATPLAQFESTWNNAGLTGVGILENITNTASVGTSKIMDLRTNNNTVFNVDTIGDVFVGAMLTLAAPGTLAFNGTIPTIQTVATGNPLVITSMGSRSGNASSATGSVRIDGGTYTGTGAGSSAPLTLHSGDASGASGNNTVAPIIIRPGLGTSATAVLNGRNEGEGYFKGAGTTTLNSLQCMTTTAFTVNDCPTSSAMPEGVANGTGATLFVTRDGWAAINSDNAVTIGHTVCTSTTVAGQIHDSGGTAACVVGTNVGRVVAVSGTATVSDATGIATRTVTLSTTLPYISLRID